MYRLAVHQAILNYGEPVHPAKTFISQIRWILCFFMQKKVYKY